ncbi:hypothetical protein ACP70R_002922 [Stipagrostis hirtigluma subsp. patula]
MDLWHASPPPIRHGGVTAAAGISAATTATKQVGQAGGRPPPMATPSSHRHRKPPPQPTEGSDGGEQVEETRDWAELPWDALLAVLRRLDHAGVLMGAGQACRPWRRAARDEPELWRRVDMRPLARLDSDVDLRAVARAAVSRSAGRCEAFWARGVADDEFLFFLADAAPGLKSLRLIDCDDISTHRIHQAIRRFPLLEELELSLGLGTCSVGLDGVGDACPLLTRLRLSRDCFHLRRGADDGEATAIAGMRGLRSLQLFGNRLGNAGLAAILDGCARLDSLDIRHCFNVKVDDDDGMGRRCGRIRTLRLPRDSTEDYDIEFGNPDMELEQDREYSWAVSYPEYL